MKHNKIIIGPSKEFKLTKQNLIEHEKFERQRSFSIVPEESGSCKYCGLSLPVSHLKQHYLNHRKEVREAPEPEEGSVQEQEAREAGVILQENSISSSDSSRQAEQVGLSRLEQYEQRDLHTSSEETDVNSDITTTDKIEEVAQLNSSDSDKVKLYIEFYLL